MRRFFPLFACLACLAIAIVSICWGFSQPAPSEGRLVTFAGHRPVVYEEHRSPFAHRNTPVHRVVLNPDPMLETMIKREAELGQKIQGLQVNFAMASSEEKVKIAEALREHLQQQFTVQQECRAHEVTRIEDRLANLKEATKKRADNAKLIVDRRLEILTTGHDYLGWDGAPQSFDASVASEGLRFAPVTPHRYGPPATIQIVPPDPGFEPNAVPPAPAVDSSPPPPLVETLDEPKKAKQ